MTRRRRFVFFLLAPLVISTSLVWASGWWLLTTENGVRFLGGLLGKTPLGAVRLQSFEGSLIDRFRLEGLVVEQDRLSLEIDSLEVAWRPGALRAGRLELLELRLRSLRLGLEESNRSEKNGERRDWLARLVSAPPLPIAVLLDRAVIDDLELLSGPAQEPWTLERLELDGGRLYGWTVHFDRLRVLARGVDARAGGRIHFQDRLLLDLRTGWRARLGAEPIAGGGTVEGDPEKVEVHQELRSPQAAPAAELTLLIETPLADPERTATRLSGRLELGSESSPAELTFDGSLHPGDEALRIRADGEWERLRWPLASDVEHLEDFRIGSPEGEIEVEGELPALALKLAGDLSVAGRPLGRFMVDARRTARGVELQRLRLALPQGVLEAEGDVELGSASRFELMVEGSSLNPAVWWGDWPGDLDFSLRARGELEGEIPRVEADVVALDGTLRELEVDGGGEVALDESGLRLEDLRLSLGEATLALDGSIEDSWDLAWQATTTELGAILPGASGELEASGRLLTAPDGSRLQARLRVRSLDVSRMTVDRAEADLDLPFARLPGLSELSGLADLEPGDLIPPASSRPLAVSLQARDLSLDAADESGGAPQPGRVELLELDTRGDLDAHTIELGMAQNGARMELEATGGLVDGAEWLGSLEGLLLTAAEPRLGLSSTTEAALRVAPRAFLLSDLRLEQEGGGEIQARASWVPESSRIELSFDGIALPPLGLLPQDDGESRLGLEGRLRGRLLARLEASRLSAEGRLELVDGSLLYDDELLGTGAVALESSTLEITDRAGQLEARLEASLVELGTLDGRLALRPGGGLPDRRTPVSGELEAHLDDLGFVAGLWPELSDPTGELHLDLEIDGRLAQPRLTGRARLRQGSVELPRWGLELDDGSLELRATGDRRLLLEGSVRSGDGELRLEGEATVTPPGEWTTSFDVRGDRFEVVDTAEIRLLVSPRVELETDGRQVRLTGEVEVPSGTIILPERRERIEVSDDVVLVNGSSQEEGREGWAMSSRLRLIVGDRVTFRGWGFDLAPSGSLLLVDEPGREARASGELAVEGGSYEVLGRTLPIQRGRLRYAGGPLGDPGLDVQLGRGTDRGVAGLDVSGTLRQPEVRLFSESPMSQQETLSQLLFGRSLDPLDATGDEADLLASAALALGLRGGRVLAESIADRFGLDEVKLESRGSLEETSLVLGTYLTPNLFVSYGLGVTDLSNLFRLRYVIGGSWTLEGEVGDETGGDVLYEIERGPVCRRQDCAGTEEDS